jgi:uncharacterized SAM-binding protein YcdF (DUF218 family)
MFFILSKTLNYLATPLVMVSLLLLASLFLKSKKWKRTMLICGVCLLLLFSNDFIANEVMRIWELPVKRYTELKQYEAAILLTGVTVNQPSGPDDRIYFYLGADRAVHTMQLYKLGIVKKIVVSGGSGKVVDDGSRESVKLKRVLMTMGVPDSVIYIDTNSDNTYENAIESKKLLDSLHIDQKECLLVTSAFHMRRALACFRKAGADMDYFTCDFRSHPRSFMLDVLLVPKVDAFIIWQSLLKEWVGFVAYKIAGYI